MEDKISIVVPVYNAEKYIKNTIDCVLNQTYDNFELILVDDGSKDGSLELIKQYEDPRIKLLVNDCPGSAARTRNIGVNEASGRYLAYLDADDLWLPSKLEKTLAFLKQEKASFVFTSYEFADCDAKPLGRIVHAPKTLDYKHALTRTVIFTSTVMFDIEKLGKEKVMMPEVPSEDTALWWSVLRSGITAHGLDENLVIYRRSANSLSSNKFNAVRRIWFLYRKMEHLSVVKSCICFVGWAFRAVARRM